MAEETDVDKCPAEFVGRLVEVKCEQTDTGYCTPPVTIEHHHHNYCMPLFIGRLVEVKPENFLYVKVEDADENYMEYQDLTVKVRVYVVHILIILIFHTVTIGMTANSMTVIYTHLSRALCK